MRNVSKWACGLLVAMAVAGCQPQAPGGGTTPSSSSGSAKQWTMPDVVGGNLQKVQDQMQKLTGDPLFLTTSHDATSRGRQQLVDSNWKVCSQTPAAGTPITIKSVIDFGAVKNNESCP
jgi:beta-lactam-binding protein with PASTA domain